VPFFIETGNAHLFPYYHEILGLFKKKLGNSPKIPGKNRKFWSKKAKIPSTYAHMTNQFSTQKVAQSRRSFFLCHKI
jgi:hypothetical protein